MLHAIGTLDHYFDQVAREISAEYLIGIEVSPEDRDGKPHRVEVEVNRKDVDVRARRQYVITPVKVEGSKETWLVLTSDLPLLEALEAGRMPPEWAIPGPSTPRSSTAAQTRR